MKLSQKRKNILGWSLMTGSFILWGAIAFLPFSNLPYRLQIGIMMYACSYALFFAGGYLLGQEKLTQWRKALYRFFQRTKNTPK